MGILLGANTVILQFYLKKKEQNWRKPKDTPKETLKIYV